MGSDARERSEDGLLDSNVGSYAVLTVIDIDNAQAQ